MVSSLISVGVPLGYKKIITDISAIFVCAYRYKLIIAF
jgi:hypothetical protein